ncbi:MAG: hypothetical protein U9O95_05345 [Candidatus Marinimicrobia bacterium]|nr:hypothetical protein [Candidatus Neomarinimicrobiota bacterium]
MKKTLLFIVVVFSFFSCTSFIYYPNGANAPLLQEKNEIQVSAKIKGLGGDIQGAWAFSDHLATQLNINFLDVFGTEMGVSHNSGQYYGDAAIGYYTSINPKIVLEAYLGTGHGTTFFRNTDTNILRTTDYHKIYAQIDMGFRTKNFKIGLALREAFVNAYRTKIDNVITGDQYIDAFFEPVIFIAIGGEKYKVNAQIGFSDSQFSSINNYAPFIFSLGLEGRFSPTKQPAKTNL